MTEAQKSESLTIDPTVAGRALGKVTTRLLPFMFLLYVWAYLDRINVSFAGLEMNRDLGFSEAVFGLGAGIFFLGYFLFGVPSNLMVERFGARRWIAVITCIWGVISVAMALTRSETTFYALRFLLGAAEAGFFPGMIYYLTRWFPKRVYGLAVARFMTAIPAAGVLGGLIASPVLQMHGLLELPGWKWLFIITGLPSVVLGLVSWHLLTDGPEKARWLAADERAWLVGALESERRSATDVHGPRLIDVIVSGRVWLLALVYFLLTLGMYGFQLWLPQIIHSFGGASDSTTALLTAVPALFQALGMIVVAGHSDRTGERRWHVTIAAATAALGLAVAASVSDAWVSLACLSLTAFGIWGTVGPFWAIPPAYLSPKGAAAGIALINSVGNLGGFAGPYLIGLVKSQTHTFVAPLLVLSGSLLLGGLLAQLARGRGGSG